jgi:hypothetical protein
MRHHEMRGTSQHAQDHQPGDPAPETGHYEQCNVFGSPTGIVRHVPEGVPLPRTATTMRQHDALIRLAERFEKLAREKPSR